MKRDFYWRKYRRAPVLDAARVMCLFCDGDGRNPARPDKKCPVCGGPGFMPRAAYDREAQAQAQRELERQQTLKLMALLLCAAMGSAAFLWWLLA